MTSLRCKLGFHAHEVYDMEGELVGPWMILGNRYVDRCPRCNRRKEFIFWIDRS